MLTAYRSVRVVPLQNGHTLRLAWDDYVEDFAVIAVFLEITNYLNQSLFPVNIIVDIKANSRFPAQTTLRSLRTGPLRHPNMGAWLFVGSNPVARAIGQFIVKMGKRQNVHWFDHEADALTYLSVLAQVQEEAAEDARHGEQENLAYLF